MCNIKKKYESVDDGEFVSKYMVLLEMFSNDIEKMFGTYYSDHSLVRLCKALENELIDGEDKYD